METTPPLPPIAIESSQLSEDALAGVISEFIMREGTDYGTAEISFDAKFKSIRRQIERGQIIITFDPNTESIHLLTKLQWAAR